MIRASHNDTALPRRAALSLFLAAPATLLAAGRGSAEAAPQRRAPHAEAARWSPPPAHRARRRPRHLERPLDARRIAFRRRETDERVDAVYFANGAFAPTEVRKIQWALRDVAGDQLGVIDPKLMELLSRVTDALEGRELVITSAFRTKETNARLRGAAPNSFHTRGMAVDFFAPELSTMRLARLVAQQQMGGVGAYPSRGFVHADVGALRVWRR